MRGLAAAAALGLAAVASAGCATMVRGSGRMVHLQREVPAFDAVHVASGIRLEIESGPQRPLEIDVDESFVDELDLEVSDGALRIGWRSHLRFFNPLTTVVRASAPVLRSVSASGGAKALGAVSRVETLDVGASGGGEVRLRGVDTADLKVDASGGGEVELRGRAAEAELNLSGGGELHGAKLEVDRVVVNGSGGASGRIWAREQAKGHLSGGASLELGGPARSRITTSGGGSVDYRD